MCLLSGEKAQALTPSVCPRRVTISPPVLLHTLRVESSDAVTNSKPSGENAQSSTWSKWAKNLCPAFRLDAFQILTVASPELETINAPSGENASAATPRPWPRKMASSVPLAPSHNLKLLSREPQTMYAPSGENVQGPTNPL